jgi:lipase ATG15
MNNFSSFNYNNYTKLFFGEDYEIKVIGNMTKEDNWKKVKMVHYFVKNKNNGKNVTILAIKGTSYKKDIYLDAQLYFPSLLLTLLNTFSNLDQQKDILPFELIEYALSIPYRLFFHFSIIDTYIKELNDAYYNYKNITNISLNETNNVVIVGHSLGGGLAKILGKILGREAISLSGPGINAFHSLWRARGKSRFELSAIDIIPDLDIVPRVEISSGTIYRILCLKSPIACHSKELSLCESLMICDNPNGEEYCLNVKNMTQNDFEKLKEKSKFIN